MKLALESLGDARNMLLYIVLTFGCLNSSFFGSPGTFLVNFLQTLPDKENNYLISEMNKVADMVDNDRFNLLLEYLSNVRILLGIFSFRVQDSYYSLLKPNL